MDVQAAFPWFERVGGDPVAAMPAYEWSRPPY